MTTSDSWQATNVRLWRAIRDRTLGPETLVVGPAGTGKTWGILDVFHCLCRDNAGLRILVSRATRAALTESALVTYEQEILPLDGMEWVAAGATRRGRQSYRYPSGSEIVLGGLDDKNASRVLSTAWDIVYINEAIEAQEGIWETILSRLNRPGRRSRFGYLLGDTNPGDPSHWLRKRIDEKKLLAEWVVPHEANPAMFDGRRWTEKGLRYLESLDRLTGTRRKRLRQGLWAAGEGQWFETFDPATHVTAAAEYDPRFKVHRAVDCGVHTGAVFFQVRPGADGLDEVNVFGDYYAFNRAAHAAACDVLDAGRSLWGGDRADRGVMDPAGNANSGFGTTVAAEYQRAGLKLDPWPSYPGSVADGLALVESFVACDPPRLKVHPRCGHLINAFANYKRKKRGGQYVDQPEDPQHPYEDVMDALRGGLLDAYPEGRRPKPRLQQVPARRVF